MKEYKQFKVLQWDIQNRVSIPKNLIQVKDNNMNDLYCQFNLIYPFNYSNFKIDIRSVNVFINHSVENKWKAK